MSFQNQKYRFSKRNQVEEHDGELSKASIFTPQHLKFLATSSLPCFQNIRTNTLDWFIIETANNCTKFCTFISLSPWKHVFKIKGLYFMLLGAGIGKAMVRANLLEVKRVQLFLSVRPGVGKLFCRRAALTISRVVEGQGLLSRTAAWYKRNCISSQFCEILWQCGISARKIGGVSKKKKINKKKKKKKGLHLFVDGKCLIGGNCRLC